MTEEWNKIHPEPPPVAPSDWYWFWYLDSKEPIVMEVWPDRKHWPEGWWGPKVKYTIVSRPPGLESKGAEDERVTSSRSSRKNARQNRRSNKE